METLTYTELKRHVDEGTLTPGTFYKFVYTPSIDLSQYDDLYKFSHYNDYEFDYNTNDYSDDKFTSTHKHKSYNSFYLIVEAISKNLLSHVAKAELVVGSVYGIDYSSDSRYFEYTDFSKWLIYYDIQNDKDKYEWADTENGKGVIYYLKDEFGNEAPFDFKNLKIRVKWPKLGQDSYQHNANDTKHTYKYLFDCYFLDYYGSSPSIDMSVNHYGDNYTPPLRTQSLKLLQADADIYYQDKQWVQYNVFHSLCYNNKVDPVFKVNGNKKTLMFPTVNFTVTLEYLQRNLPIANNYVSANCQGFELINCFGCKNKFTYYVNSDPYIIDFSKDKILRTPTGDIEYTNNEYWETTDCNQTTIELLDEGTFTPVLYSSGRIQMSDIYDSDKMEEWGTLYY